MTSTSVEHLEPYAGGLVLSPDAARRQVELVREVMESVMVEGRDYGVVPGTDRPALFKSGAELLLKVFGYGHRLHRVETERDHAGNRIGVTYCCEVIAGPREHETLIATCDGYCGYDESKYHQTAEELEARERRNAEHYRRQPNPLKWAEPYTAPWNTVVKMSEKRALVGATLQACAASGLFTQDVEDQAPRADGTPPPTPEQEGPPQFERLGYEDVDELRSVNDSLVDLMKQVPKERAERVGALFDEAGYPKGQRFPVAKADVERIRAILRSAIDGTDEALTPPESPVEAETRDSEPPAAADEAQEPEEQADDGFRSRLDDLWDGENPEPVIEAINALSTGDLSFELQNRGLDPFLSTADGQRALAEAIVARRSETRPAPRRRAKSERETPASDLHRTLGALGLAADDHKAVIAAASGGRTEHASELSAAELAVAEGIGRAVHDEETTLDAVRASIPSRTR